MKEIIGGRLVNSTIWCAISYDGYELVKLEITSPDNTIQDKILQAIQILKDIFATLT